MTRKSTFLKKILPLILLIVSANLNISYAEESRLRIPVIVTTRQTEALSAAGQTHDYYILGAGIYIKTDGKERVLCKGHLLEAVQYLRQNYRLKEAQALVSEFKRLYAKWKKKYPVLEEEISGPINFEIAENLPATCEMNTYTNTFKIDIAVLASPYLFRIEALEALDHQARVLLDSESDIDAKRKAHYKFWAFEEFCSDYEKAVIFARDYQSLKKNDTKQKRLLSLQADAIALLAEKGSKYIEVIFKAISSEHKNELIESLKSRLQEPALRKLREMLAYTNDADLAFKIKDYAKSAYPDYLYSHIERLGYDDIMTEVRATFAHYKTLRGRYGRGYYHGINKMKLGINRALQGKQAFFDLLVVVVEDKSEKETRDLIEEARGKYISNDQKVIVIAQPTIDTIRENMIKGNWSAVINILLAQ